MNQSAFLHTISRYFNTGSISRSDKILSAIKPDWPLKRNAGKIKSCFRELIDSDNPAPISEYIIDTYSGNNNTALKISAYLKRHLADDLLGAIVHGSIATDEKINYSDFDGLVIIKNEVFNSLARIKHVATHLSKSYSLMIQGDPLQHHGWFIVIEKDFKNWPASYFPPDIFNYSRSLLGNSLNLQLHCIYKPDESRASLLKMTGTIRKNLSINGFPDNAYQLKSLFSEFMLLPALFIQTVTNKGIYKKHSFTEAKKYFKPDIWTVMDTISDIRSGWDINAGILLPDKPVLVTPAIKKKQVLASATIPEHLQSHLTKQLKTAMVEFIKSVEIEIK